MHEVVAENERWAGDYARLVRLPRVIRGPVIQALGNLRAVGREVNQRVGDVVRLARPGRV